MSDPPLFSSECPRCRHERPLTGYARDELLELLESGGEIEGYCGNCDERWPISTEERADLLRALSR
jgi:redox-regulated HSP33 family molecular chaperone